MLASRTGQYHLNQMVLSNKRYELGEPQAAIINTDEEIDAQWMNHPAI